MSRLRVRQLIAVSLAVAGCAGRSSKPAPSAPVAARFVPPADRYVRSVLLDFESKFDAAFVDAADKRDAVDPAFATNRVLYVNGEATVRLGALVRGRAFPGTWDLVGVRIATPTAATCAVKIADGEATLASADASLAGGRWRTIWLDLHAIAAATRPATSMPSDETLTLRIASPGGVMIDEVVLAQSRIVVAESASPRTNEPFRVERVGTTWRATLAGRPIVELPAAPFVEDGYRVAESCAARVVFREPLGATVAVDRLGRIWRGERGVSPPTIEVVEGPARVERNAAGDRDNDGFDESRGGYALRAAGDRFTFRIDGSPTSPASWPTVDVAGLGGGAVSVWVEGQVVHSVTRATDGRATIELPLEVVRPVDVQVRVRG